MTYQYKHNEVAEQVAMDRHMAEFVCNLPGSAGVRVTSNSNRDTAEICWKTLNDISENREIECFHGNNLDVYIASEYMFSIVINLWNEGNEYKAGQVAQADDDQFLCVSNHIGGGDN